MKRNLQKKYTLLVVGSILNLFFCNKVLSQNDAQYTMYMFNQLAFNPAYAGSKDVMTITTHYRNQWAGVKGAPETFTFGAHMPFFGKRCGAGLSIIADKIGMMNTYFVDLSYNYKVRLSNETKLSMGLDGQVDYSRMDWNESLAFDNTDSDLSTGTESRLNPNFGLGLYLNNPKYYIGVSVPRILKTSIYDKELNKEISLHTLRSYYIAAGFLKRLSNKVELQPGALLTISPNAPFEADLNFNILFLHKLLVGASYRLHDSFDVIIQYQATRQLKVATSFDLTTSALRPQSSGSFELMLEYAFYFNEIKVNNPRFF